MLTTPSIISFPATFSRVSDIGRRIGKGEEDCSIVTSHSVTARSTTACKPPATKMLSGIQPLGQHLALE